MNYDLSYVGFLSVIEGYSDASWITNSEDHTYTIGWVFLLGGGAISWDSKKQTCIAYSTMEKDEFNVESLQLKIGTHHFILRCKTKGTTYVSMEFCRFKKVGLGFLYAHEGYGHKAL
ncbi:hypothetical protein Tco_0764051 [Tanacetum coccineum]